MPAKKKISSKKVKVNPVLKEINKYNKRISRARIELNRLIESVDSKTLMIDKKRKEFESKKRVQINKILSNNLTLSSLKKNNDIKSRKNSLQNLAKERSAIKDGGNRFSFGFYQLKSYRKKSLDLLANKKIKSVNGVNKKNKLLFLDEFDKMETELDAYGSIVVSVNYKTGMVNIYLKLPSESDSKNE